MDKFLKLAWIPIVVAFLNISITIYLWQRLLDQEDVHISKSIESNVINIINDVKNPLDTRILALEHMAQRWIIRGATPEEEWKADAENFIINWPDFQAIEWVDKSFYVRWISNHGCI